LTALPTVARELVVSHGAGLPKLSFAINVVGSGGSTGGVITQPLANAAAIKIIAFHNTLLFARFCSRVRAGNQTIQNTDY
jgi:hypothetical protein